VNVLFSLLVLKLNYVKAYLITHTGTLTMCPCHTPFTVETKIHIVNLDTGRQNVSVT